MAVRRGALRDFPFDAGQDRTCFSFGATPSSASHPCQRDRSSLSKVDQYQVKWHEVYVISTGLYDDVNITMPVIWIHPLMPRAIVIAHSNRTWESIFQDRHAVDGLIGEAG